MAHGARRGPLDKHGVEQGQATVGDAGLGLKIWDAERSALLGWGHDSGAGAIVQDADGAAGEGLLVGGARVDEGVLHEADAVDAGPDGADAVPSRTEGRGRDL